MSITEKLKADTQEAHLLLESHAWLKLLLSDRLTIAAYARVLQLFYGYFAPLELQLSRFPELLRFLPDLPARRKAAALLTDLENLNSGLFPENAPLFELAPLPQSLAQCFGCLYVLEGSTLGGKFIAQQVRKTLGAEAAQALSFFSGYGQQTGQYWKTFRAALVTYNNLHPSDKVIVQAATTTFRQFHYWLTVNESNYHLRTSV